MVIIDILVIVLTAILFGKYIFEVFMESYLSMYSIQMYFFTFTIALAVNTLKAIRLYLICFEQNSIRGKRLLKEYCITSAVNNVIPFKLGELYRGYRLGKLSANYFDGYIIVLYDRFIDTLALVSLTAGLYFIWNITLNHIWVIFLFFLILLIFLWLIFAQLYKVWNHMLVFNRNSSLTLNLLMWLSYINRGVMQINKIIKGKFLITLILSLLAWCCEIGGVLVINDFDLDSIGNYIESLFHGTGNHFNALYVIFSLCIYMVTYIFLLNKRRVGK